MDVETRALQDAGLTEYQARCYIALLSLGGGHAARVAEAAHVPRTRVYGVLDDLIEAGWVEAEEGRPRAYRARPPEVCVAEARARVQARIDDALPSLRARHEDREQRFAGDVWLLEGKGAMLRRAVVMMKAARDEVFLGASVLGPLEDALVDALRDAADRGVVVRTSAPHGGSAAEALEAAGLRPSTAPLPVQILQVDGKQGLITFFLARDGGLRLRSIWNPNPELAGLMAESFRAMGKSPVHPPS